MTNWEQLTECCQIAMKLAANNPGRYGGLYVGRFTMGEFCILEDDDPENVPEDFDVFAQVTPEKVHPIGRARAFLRESGEVAFRD